ncbi:MAG: zinc-dependent metalloprotease [Saprospiraceae bacterium]|nr:zinc-dependent metalloprotease [Saprospiraceae bacterium]
MTDAFASSILYSFAIEKDTNDEVYIDLAPFLTEDQMGAVQQLKEMKQGGYKLDKSRSVVVPESLLAFPFNVEFESWLTLAGEATGEFIKSVAPTPELISYRQHTSFVALPAEGYEPREYHPFSGYFHMAYYDYASPIHVPIEKKWLLRHRLDKKNPGQGNSEVRKPIIYYVDPGCPEPIKSALMEGASWWNEAFEYAGYVNAFQVKELPADAHPLDVRYNTIQWVHRSTRGWSYGSTISDPRTGEIIKGHVTLGSLRVRQDFMIAQGLLSLYRGNNKDHGPMTLLALARLRQLSAHEVGHTLGLAHNFAASINERASVMDYPHPNVLLNKEGDISIDSAYDSGIGIWDKQTILYGYAEDGSDENLKSIIATSKKSGLKYLSDPDARPDGSASAEGHLWDNGRDPLTELDRILQLRKVALVNFGENSIPEGTPFSELEKVLVPVYHMQRYQVEAVSKLIGGMFYEYGVKGEEVFTPTSIVELTRQKQAVAAIALTLSDNHLRIPDHILRLVPPSAYGFNRSQESMKAETGYGLDQIAAATATIDHALSLLLHEQRLARINNPGQMGLKAYFNYLFDQLKANSSGRNETDLDFLRERRFVIRMAQLAYNQKKPEYAMAALHFLMNFEQKAALNSLLVNESHYNYLKFIIQKVRDNEPLDLPVPVSLPPGAPIGCE